MVALFDAVPPFGYEPTLATLLATLDDGTREWRDELGEIEEEHLTQRVFAGGPSLGAVLLHVAEAEAWWIEAVVGGRPLSEDFKRRTLLLETRQDEGIWGDAPKVPYSAYLEILDEVRARSREILRTETNPERSVRPDPNRPSLTVRWILGHVVQHDSYHGGQCVLLKRIVGGAIW